MAGLIGLFNLKIMTLAVNSELNSDGTEAEVLSESVHQPASVANESLLGSLGINGQLFIFQFINFAIVAVIIWFLILKPLVKKMSERQKMIEDSIDNAKVIETNLQMSEKKYQEKIDEAKVEANKIIENSRLEAIKLSEDMKIKAKDDIEVLVEKAKQKIKLEKEEMSEELKKETIALVALAVEKILEEKMDSESDKKLIEKSLKNI
jgi:ATP synthase F0 subunit b